MAKITNVLSLFDGLSCGQIALNRAGIEYDNYFASEIDNYAIKVTQANYPKTIQLGDVCGIQYEDGALFHHQNDNPLKNGGSFITKIDLLIGGSPCQGFSFAGKGLNFEDPRSKLFFEFVRLKNETQPKYFLLENVVMKKEHEKVISEFLGVEPILINSNLVSAQNRKRLYWTNIPNITQPKNKGIKLKDILENGYVDREKSLCLTRGYAGFTGSQSYLCRRYFGKSFGQAKFVSAQSYISVKSKWKENNYFDSGEIEINKLSITEVERLQTLPDGYTECDGVSYIQRVEAVGNGWTVDVIAHIFGSLLNGA
jgi:site-specific DNA-cytosine methylase